MQIRNVSADHPDPTTLAKPGDTGEATGSRPPKAGELHAFSATRETAALAEILSRYDVTDISPTEFSQMIQRLFGAGALSEKELQQLAAIRIDLDVDGVEADESVDLLEFYARKIKKLQSRLSDSDTPAADHQQLSPLLHRLDWLEKFALIQSAPEAIGLDAVA